MIKKRPTTKYIVLVGDGMADYPVKELDGKTPLEVAHTPNMDRIAARRIGLAKTIPDGLEAGSDIANLSLLGYDPAIYHTGRAPLEAASMGVELETGQIAFRMNLVTLDIRSSGEIIMISHSAGDITAGEAAEIVRTLKEELIPGELTLHTGVAYRHLLVWDDGPENAETIPPHDVLEQDMAPYLNPSSGNPVVDLICRSWSLLKEHPVNLERRRSGLREANSIWPWGQGKALRLPLFEEKFEIRGGVISAVDLIKGIGTYAGFVPLHVEGATGYLNTNYRGKAEEALKALHDLDFVFLHVEAPDEGGHSGIPEEKIKAVTLFDERVVGPVLEGLNDFDAYRVMVVSDHFTPLILRTHTSDPTPFAWASREEMESTGSGPGFTENAARQSGLFFEKGHDLMASFLDRVGM